MSWRATVTRDEKEGPQRSGRTRQETPLLGGKVTQFTKAARISPGPGPSAVRATSGGSHEPERLRQVAGVPDAALHRLRHRADHEDRYAALPHDPLHRIV